MVHTLAQLGAERLWELLHASEHDHGPRRVTGDQAVQMVKAGLQAIYLCGWQVAADANLAGQMYPDQSLYPANSVPTLVRGINNALLRADQIEHAEGKRRHRLARADRRRCRGGLRRAAQRLRADEVDDRGRRRGRALRGSARVREEVRPHGRQGARPDAASSSARSSPRGSRPTSSTCRRCSSPAPTRYARRCSRATSIRADRAVPDRRADARGFFSRARRDRGGDRARRSPTRPTPTCSGARPRRRTSTRRRAFAEAIHEQFPGKLLAYNCSPSFNWRRKLDDAEIAKFQRRPRRPRLPVPVHHARRLPLAQLIDVRARARLRDRGDAGVRELQEHEFELEASGYTATRHQREVGAGYFDRIAEIVGGGESSTLALRGSTEAEQFESEAA